MKKYLYWLTTTLLLTACNAQDTRIQAANVIYSRCIENGENTQWCRCLRADLIDSTNQFTEEIANYILQGRQHPWLSTAITGARLRCQCRIFPQRMLAHGLSCTGVKPIKF